MSSHRFLKVVSSAALALAVVGCASTNPKDQIQVVGHTQTHGMDPIASAAYWGTRYDRAPTDPVVAVAYSKALRVVENNKEALRVIQHAAVRVGDDPDILLETGKALIASDRAHEAVRPIQSAIALGKRDDWSAYSALGVAYDKIGKHKWARQQYDLALGLAPNKAQVLNNKGLSFALQGNKVMAERVLRTATAGPEGTARIRQNLALVLALSGQRQEAERLARSDLPPAVADQNVTYYQQLVAQPARWQDLNRDNIDLPTFGDEGETASMAPRSTPIPDPKGVAPARRYAPQPSQPTPPAAPQTAAPRVQAAAPQPPVTLAYRSE